MYIYRFNNVNEVIRYSKLLPDSCLEPDLELESDELVLHISGREEGGRQIWKHEIY